MFIGLVLVCVCVCVCVCVYFFSVHGVGIYLISCEA